MSKIKKSTIVAICFVALSAAVYYWYATEMLGIDFGFNQDKEMAPVTAVITPVDARKVSAVATYMATESKQDSIRFVVTVDKNGIITDLTTLDAETGEIPEKKIAFNTQASTMIMGKKLSELTAIDNVAKSTLTTKAFNGVIDELKSQL